MKALPVRFERMKRTLSIDKSVTFVVEPLQNLIYSHIEGRNTEWNEKASSWDFNSGGRAFDIVGFSLKELEGIEDLELEFEAHVIGGETHNRVTNDCLNRIPKVAFDEIWLTAASAHQLMEAEIDNVGFTGEPSLETSSVPETSEPALAEAD